MSQKILSMANFVVRVIILEHSLQTSTELHLQDFVKKKYDQSQTKNEIV